MYGNLPHKKYLMPESKIRNSYRTVFRYHKEKALKKKSLGFLFGALIGFRLPRPVLRKNQSETNISATHHSLYGD
jgi:hypothetical protein